MWFAEVLDLLSTRVVLIVLAFVRMATFIAMWPLIAEQLPRTIKVALALTLTIVSVPAILSSEVQQIPTNELFFAIFREAMLGLGAGFLIRLMLSAASVAGEAIAQATGLGSPSIFNPELGSQETPISRAVSLSANLLVFTLGIHRHVILLLLEAFKAVPVGSAFDTSSWVPMLVSHASAAIEFGLILALPAIGLGILVQLAMAVVTRIAPSLQIFNAGFPIILLVGLTTVGLSLPTIISGLSARISDIPRNLEQLLVAMLPP